MNSVRDVFASFSLLPFLFVPCDAYKLISSFIQSWYFLFTYPTIQWTQRHSMTPTVSFNKNKLNELMGTEEKWDVSYYICCDLLRRWRSKWPHFEFVVGNFGEQRSVDGQRRKEPKKFAKIWEDQPTAAEKCAMWAILNVPSNVERLLCFVFNRNEKYEHQSKKKKKKNGFAWLDLWMGARNLSGVRLLPFHRAFALVTTLFYYYYFYITFSVRKTSEIDQQKQKATSKKLNRFVGKLHVCLSVGFPACKRFLWLRRIALASHRSFDATGSCKWRARALSRLALTRTACVVVSTQAQPVPTLS